MAGTYFEFREVTTANELEAIFKLRYKLYRDSRLKDFCEENQCGVDIDCYELYSRHMGLFKCDGESRRLIGFHRPVFAEERKVKGEVLAAADAFPKMISRVMSRPAEPLPIMEYWPDREAVRKFYDESSSIGEIVAEATKFSIEPEESSLNLARFVIEAELAIQMFCNNANHALMGICNSHLPLYSRYGFTLVPGTKIEELRGVQAVCVSTSRRQIPSKARQRLMKLAVAYLEAGRVCYNTADPGSFYAPSSRSNWERGLAA